MAALEELRHLPRNLRRVVLLRSQLSRHQDVAEVLGVTTGRVARLLQDVGVQLQQRAELRAELDRPVANPRAARLRELELDPPKWLPGSIGRAPYMSKSSSKLILTWRRAALAIDGYRQANGWDHEQLAIGPTPIQPAVRRARQHVERMIADVRQERVLRKDGQSREL